MNSYCFERLTLHLKGHLGENSGSPQTEADENQTVKYRKIKTHFLTVASALFILVSSIAHPKPNLDNWIRVDAGNLAFSTNLAAQEAEELANELLTFMSFSEAFLPQRPGYKIPLQLIVFSNKADFDTIVRPKKFASFTHSDLSGVLVVAAPSSERFDDLLENITHELSHYQMRHAPLNYPLWYEEGLATMLSNATLIVEENKLKAEFKTPNTSASFPLNRSTKPIRQSWLVRHLGRKHLNNLNLRIIHNFYNDSHRLAHLFQFNQTEDPRFSTASMERYLQDQSDSLLSSLKVTPNELMNALARHQEKIVEPRRLTFDASEISSKIQISTLTKAEALKQLSVASALTNPRGAINHLNQIILSDSSDYLSMLELANLHAVTKRPDKSLKYLSKAKKINRGNSRVKIAEASMLIRSCKSSSGTCADEWLQAGDLIREALETEPENIEAIYSLGVIELYSGRPGTALNYLKVAEDHAPWSPRINFHLGEALRLLGNPSGKGYLIKARDWSSAESWRKMAEQAINEYNS
ncbi:hypothetical protein OAL14_06445 [Gammaproteobacteria bacterium]|nr:hypothetical protein [Gammaproteobacteria bacterium]